MSSWIVFSGANRTTARALNISTHALDPRLIDLGPNAGSFALNATILTAPGYGRFVATITGLSRVTAEITDIFNAGTT